MPQSTPSGKTLLIHSLGLLLALAALALPAAAQDSRNAEISDLNWMDRQHLKRQVERIDELGRQELGQPVRGNKDDLELLQRIIHRGLIERDDVLGQQALGAVLGNVMVNEIGLEWQRYEDRRGLSRAVCATEARECLFPVTMLSRRMEVGLVPDVDRIYRDAHEMISTVLPKNPYDVEAP